MATPKSVESWDLRAAAQERPRYGRSVAPWLSHFSLLLTSDSRLRFVPALTPDLSTRGSHQLTAESPSEYDYCALSPYVSPKA